MAKRQEDSLAPFTYIWKIENYPKLPAAFRVSSPKFTLDSMGGTQWELSLYALFGMHLFECTLNRLGEGGPELIEIKYDLSILSAEGKPLLERERMYAFTKNSGDRVFTFERVPDFSKRRAELLPRDTATLRCRMWRIARKVPETDLCLARTHLGSERLSFMWPIEGFGAVVPSGERSRILKFSFKGFELFLELALYFTRRGVEDIMGMKIIKSKSTKSFHLSWEITFVAADGRMFLSEKFHKYFADREIEKDVGRLFATDMLRAYKVNYFPYDALCLKCEFEVQVGEMWRRIEYSTTGEVEDTEVDCSNKVVSICCPLKTYVRTLYRDQSLLDVIFRIDGEMLHAHKSILGARSSVFKEMFSKEAKEMLAFDISGVNFDAFRTVLRYIYTDTLPHFEWQSALDLFKVADKYKILDIRRECFIFIKENITEDNFFDVITLLYLHNEEHFKEAVEKFASIQGIAKARSELWDALIHDNPREALKNIECIDLNRIYYLVCHIFNEVFNKR